MTDKRANERSPHGVTGDTVQQAAEVSKPTSSVGRVLNDDPRVPQAHPDEKPGVPARGGNSR